jgi:hypothetical protein
VLASLPYLRETGGAGATSLVVSLRSFELDFGYKYVLSFVGDADQPKFQMVDRSISRAITATGALTILEADIQRGLAPYLESVAAATTQSGTTTLSLRDPTSRSAGESSGDSSLWYASLGGSGGLVSGTTSTLTMSGATEVNYSAPRWRFNLRTQESLTRVQVQFGQNQEQTAVATTFKGRALLARNVSEHWSLAVSSTYLHDSANNLTIDARAEGGIEWDLVPILATNDHSLGFRYAVGAEEQRYDETNLLGRYRSTFAEHLAGAYLTWHFTTLDVSADLYATSIVDNLRFATVSSDVSLTWRLTDRFALSLSANASYRQALLNQPMAAPDTGLSQYVAGGNYAALTYGSTIAFLYTLGNAGLSRQDQRWRPLALEAQ